MLLLLCLTPVAHADENPAGRTRTGEVGDALEYIIPAVALTGTLFNKDWQGSKQFSLGLLSTLALSHGLKAVISKERPDGRDDNSFPSSHTAVSVHAAAYLHERYGWRYGLPAYVAAAYVGYSRVHDERHDEQDVLVGALLGYASAKLLTTRYERLRVTPMVGEVRGEDAVGLTVSYRF